MPKILQARRFGIGRVVTCVSIFTLQTIFFYGQSTKTSAEPSIPARGSAAIADLTPSEVAGQQNYDQPMRPQLHYSVLQGHIGDATGLVSYRGEFHLFNIFDEWARRSSTHKRWGHAVSTDLVHWTQMPAELDTLIDHAPGSGSGVVDWNNSSGLRTGPEKTLVIFYTDYQNGSSILFSNDRGRTWERYKNNPVLSGVDDIRDPNVFWYPEASQWRMVRYEKRGFTFYASTDLIHWSQLSRIDGFYECPDLFEMRMTNSPSEHRWILVDGDGSYVVGQFDGTRFIPESGKLRAEYGTAFYAGQTWKRAGANPVQIGWLRYPAQSTLTWDGQMSFPVDLTLRRMPEGIRLVRQPVSAIDELRLSRHTWKDLKVASTSESIPGLQDSLLQLDVVMESAGATEFGLAVHGLHVGYSAVAHTLNVGSASAPLQLDNGRLHLRLIIDRSSVEVFTDPGTVSISTIVLAPVKGPVTFFASGGTARVDSLVADTLESIWLNHY
jgi:fructan beta-fructosidase